MPTVFSPCEAIRLVAAFQAELAAKWEEIHGTTI
jgi:hypothetical protein